MINLPRTIPLSNTDRLTFRRLEEEKKVDKIQPMTDLPEQKAQPVGPEVKRRRGRDRRQHHQPNYPFDTRAGQDRRQRYDPDHPPIDEKA